MKTTKMLMLMAVLIISSCKKNDNETLPISKNCKIVSVKDGNNPASTYTYDVNGKILNISNYYYPGDALITYQTGSIKITNSINGKKESFNIDNSGRITSDSYDTYKYSPDGYLIEKTHLPSTTPEYVLSYSNGNLTKVIIDGKDIVNITYYENETNQNLLGYESAVYSPLIFNQHTFSNLTATFIGKVSKNLIKTITMQRSQTGGVTDSFKETYVYNKDQDGKITSLIITSEAPKNYFNGTSSINFTYQCQ